MMKSEVIILVLAGVCMAFCWSLDAQSVAATMLDIQNPEDFSESKSSMFRQLQPDFSKIDSALCEQLPDNDEPRANIKLAEEILNGKKVLSLKEFSLKWALTIFISLKETMGRCDFKSYEILAQTKLATDGLPSETTRVRRIVDQLRRQHAFDCRPRYKREYAASLAKINPDNLKRLQAVLRAIKPENIVAKPTPGGGQWPDSINIFAQSSLAIRDGGQCFAAPIVTMIKQDQKWTSFRSILDKKDPFAFYGLKQVLGLKKFIGKYLMSPCKEYVKHTKEVLAPARFDAAIRDEQQYAFLTEDQMLAKAIADYRICKFLLKSDAESIIAKALAEY